MNVWGIGFVVSITALVLLMALAEVIGADSILLDLFDKLVLRFKAWKTSVKGKEKTWHQNV